MLGSVDVSVATVCRDPGSIALQSRGNAEDRKASLTTQIGTELHKYFVQRHGRDVRGLSDIGEGFRTTLVKLMISLMACSGTIRARSQ